METDLGPEVRPYLQEVWADLQKVEGAYPAGSSRPSSYVLGAAIQRKQPPGIDLSEFDSLNKRGLDVYSDGHVCYAKWQEAMVAGVSPDLWPAIETIWGNIQRGRLAKHAFVTSSGRRSKASTAEPVKRIVADSERNDASRVPSTIAGRSLWAIWLWPSVLFRLAATGLLLWSFKPHEYGYYQILRWATCSAGVCSVVLSSRKHAASAGLWVTLFAAVAMLYNPVVPIHLSRSAWTPVDLSVAALLLVSLIFVRGQEASHSRPSA
jgi:hypothetical protein